MYIHICQLFNAFYVHIPRVHLVILNYCFMSVARELSQQYIKGAQI